MSPAEVLPPVIVGVEPGEPGGDWTVEAIAYRTPDGTLHIENVYSYRTTIEGVPMQKMKFSKFPPGKGLIDWKPRKWAKSDRKLWHGNGRIKPRGARHTKSPASIRRKARSLAGRKAA